jgi:hypothetical protein
MIGLIALLELFLLSDGSYIIVIIIINIMIIRSFRH